jgi:tetratricopeptide (TPR) repeat protein
MRWYGVDVQYKYSVGDRDYVSHKISLRDGLSRNPKNALKIMNKYRHQHEVTVFYNPADSQQAVLEPADMGDIAIPLIVGGLLVLLWFIAFFDQSVEITNHGRDKYLHAGDVYQQQGKLDEALHEYNKIIESGPYLAIGYIRRGRVYLQKGNWDSAIADFNQAIKIDPLAAIVYFNRANAYLGNKRYDKAWMDMQKAMEMGFEVKPEIWERIKKGL